jgi:hypothetical protein
MILYIKENSMAKKRIVTHRQLARHNGWHNEYHDDIEHDPIDKAAWCVIIFCIVFFVFFV